MRLERQVRALALAGPGTAWLMVFVAMAAVFLVTATYDARQSIDTGATALQAWTLALRGHPDVSDVAWAPWTVERPGGGLVTNRFPGPVLVSIPAYWIAGRLGLFGLPEDFSFVPAGITAALMVAAAVTFFSMALARLLPGEARRWRWAVPVAALGTSVWSVAANAMWPHTVTLLGISLVTLGMSRTRWPAIACGSLIAVLGRPHVGPSMVLLALLMYRRGERAQALAAGIGAMLGGGLFLIYGRLLFGAWRLTGGYSPENIAAPPAVALDGPLAYLENVVMALVSPTRGILIWSPFLVLLLPMLRRAWHRSSEGWTKDLAWAALPYAVIQLGTHRYTGGDAFFSYRVTLEILALLTPLLLVAWLVRQDSPGFARGPFRLALSFSIMLHAAGATVLTLGVLDRPWW